MEESDVPAAVGDCYEVAIDYIFRHGNRNKTMLLVHGVVEGQKALEGLRFGHAWIEVDDLVGTVCIDNSNGRKFKVPKKVYYKVGNVENSKGKLHKYTLHESLEMVQKYKTYGHWELDTKW